MSSGHTDPPAIEELHRLAELLAAPIDFEGLTAAKEVHIEGAHVEALIRESFAYAPIRLASKEAIRLYVVRENVQSTVRRCVVFTTGHLRYRADARFDLAYWNLANFAEL